MSGQDSLDLLAGLVERARKLGAEAADAVLVDNVSLSAAWRLGKLERLDRSESGDVGLRVLMGRRQAMVSSSDRSPKALADLVERAVAMAKLVPEDPFCGLADPADLARDLPDLDLCDACEPSPEDLARRAQACEDAARSYPGITNSEGAEASWGRSSFAIAGSNGLARASQASSVSQGVAVVAGEGTGMERDHDYAVAVYLSDMPSPESTGQEAARRAVARLKPRKMPTARVPVIYEARVARGLLSHLAGAINGASIARGTSFLKDKLQGQIFAPGVTIQEDPLRKRGLRSRPCDAEGIACQPRRIIDNGRLTTWLLDLRSARQLGLKSTGHASRGTSSAPSPSSANLWLEAGNLSLAEMIAGIEQGFLVTELVGMGVNGLTGDYSRGAAGYWIEKGQIAFPVSEMTVAGNLKDMFLNLTPASDLEMKFGMDSPSVRIEGLTVAGA
jgi:PmbA protein